MKTIRLFLGLIALALLPRSSIADSLRLSPDEPTECPSRRCPDWENQWDVYDIKPAQGIGEW